MATGSKRPHFTTTQNPTNDNTADRLGKGGGGPHDPGMDARMAAVEADLKEIKGVLGRLEPLLGRMDDRMRKMEVDTLPKLGSDFAELKGRVSQLPGTIQLVGFVLAVLAIAGLTRFFVH